MSNRILLSVVTGCYNEEENVIPLFQAITEIFERDLPHYDFEVIFIDNSSQDRTVDLLKEQARIDKRLKIIVNNRNFGHVRSSYHAMLQARGMAVIAMASDFQDPPSMIPTLVERWRQAIHLFSPRKRVAANQRSSIGSEKPTTPLSREFLKSIWSRM